MYMTDEDVAVVQQQLLASQPTSETTRTPLKTMNGIGGHDLGPHSSPMSRSRYLESTAAEATAMASLGCLRPIEEEMPEPQSNAAAEAPAMDPFVYSGPIGETQESEFDHLMESQAGFSPLQLQTQMPLESSMDWSLSQ
jgi:hypothetical protein